MKKIIAVIAVAMLIGCMAFVFSACGGDDNNTTTTVPNTTDVTPAPSNPGVVTDESENDDNGVLGDVVTDISEGVSDMVTDVSEGVSDMMD